MTTLPRERRVRKRKDFLFIQRSGVRANRSVVTLVGRKSKGPGRVGFTVPKAVGNAVKRNLVKRRLRHIARTNLVFEDLDLVMIAHAKAAEQPFEELQRQVLSALVELQKKIAQGPKRKRNKRPPKRV